MAAVPVYFLILQQFKLSVKTVSLQLTHSQLLAAVDQPRLRELLLGVWVGGCMGVALQQPAPFPDRYD